MQSRAFIEQVSDTLIAGMRGHASSSGALMDIDGDPADRLEGVSRVFLLAALRLAAGGGEDADVAAWMRQVLDVGMDPAHRDSWPPQTDHSQVTVEATVVAVGLHLTRAWVFDRLPRVTRQRVLEWLAAEHWCADNNHVLFGAICQAFRHREGQRVDGAAIWAALDHIEEWYVGDGWYSDGEGRRFDHYNAWTFHLYPFWLLDLLDPEGIASAPRREVYRDRLRMFLASYRELFARDGSFVALGRSLIYRFGVLAPFWMAEIEGCSPLAPGEAATLTRRCTELFLDHQLWPMVSSRSVGTDLTPRSCRATTAPGLLCGPPRDSWGSCCRRTTAPGPTAPSGTARWRLGCTPGRVG